MRGPAAIIAAGGTGSRSASTVPKQFRPLGGKSVLAWSVEAVIEAGCDPVVIAVPEDHLAEAQREFSGRAVVMVGGSTRQGSVAACLTEVTTDLVLVHDGARPFITPALVRTAVGAIGERDGVVVAIPMDETIKSVKEGTVVKTVERDGLWRVQTPQVFRTSVLRKAHTAAGKEGWNDAVDDAALIERIGGTIGIVPGTRRNLKITLPEDFLLAEALAAAGEP